MSQLPLTLKPRFTWGGARPGAGRKATSTAGVPHRARPKHTRHHPGHITLRVAKDVANLRKTPQRASISAALSAGRERQGFRLVHYAILSNHLHLIAEASNETELARGIKGLQVRIARALNKLLGRRGRLFGDRYHARALKTPREVRNGIAYVLLNARKHGSRSRDLDPCSSAKYFDGWRGQKRIALDEERPVAAARTWLMRVGWRRHGLISPAEIPSCGTKSA